MSLPGSDTIVPHAARSHAHPIVLKGHRHTTHIGRGWIARRQSVFSLSINNLSHNQLPFGLGLPTHLRCPPPRPHQQKSPVLQKLRRLPFDRVPHKLQQPPKAEQPDSHPQQSVPHNRRQQHRQRQNNNRYPKRMRQPVQRMLMALRVLRDPTFPTTSAQHGDTIP